MKRPVLALTLFFMPLVGGCELFETNPYDELGEGESCDSSLDCSGSLYCIDGACGYESGGGTSTGTGTGSSSSTHPYWCRSDGARTAQLLLSGGTAKACTPDFGETIGSFDGTSMTFTIEGNRLEFPLTFSGGSLTVGAPDPSTNSATLYTQCSTYDCSPRASSGGSSGGSSSGGTTSGSSSSGSSEPPPNRCGQDSNCVSEFPYACPGGDSCYKTYEACAYDPICQL